MNDSPKNEGLHGHLDVLGSIPCEYRTSVLEQCGRRRYKKGDVIWHQGDVADYVGFLVQGKAMSTYTSPGGKIGVTGFWSCGDILGAVDLGFTKERQMTVRCLEESAVLSLSIGRFFEIVTRFPEFAQTVIQALSIRLRWVAHLALTLETRNAFERVCAMLLALCETFGREEEDGWIIDLSLTNEGLAAIVGVSRQFANVTLHELQDRNLIRLKGRKIVVIDRLALEAAAFMHSEAGGNSRVRNAPTSTG